MSVAVVNRFIGRNSTTAPILLADVVDWLLAASIALAIVVALVGIDVKVGGVALKSHSAGRVLVASLVLFALRWRMGLPSPGNWLARLTLLVTITGSIVTWFRFLLSTIGGADSYGYVSASHMLAGGHLFEAAPIAEWLSAANRLAIASPLGWAPAANGMGIVPTYPLGMPFLMAAFSKMAGSDAVFLVSPVMALLTLRLVYRAGRDWFDAEVALLATALLAWNPVFLTYAKQPMSDATATAWVTLAVVLSLRQSTTSAFVAGLAAGAAVITRPALLIAAAVIPFLSFTGDSKKQRFVLSAIGAAIGVAVQMLLQAKLFGSPFASGYGSTASLFAWSHVPINLGIFGRQIWFALDPIWLIGLLLGFAVASGELRWRLIVLMAAVTLPYLFWLPFDHWETLRFLLPGIAILSVIVAAGFAHIAKRLRPGDWAVAITVLIVVLFAGHNAILLRDSSQFAIQEMESRYPLAGEWININTPSNSVVMANQHSGSLRWYGKRQTIRWDFVDPSQLTTTVRELQSHDATVYVALEGDEVAMFDQRFKSVIDQLQVDHVGSIRNVSFRRLLAPK